MLAPGEGLTLITQGLEVRGEDLWGVQVKVETLADPALAVQVVQGETAEERLHEPETELQLLHTDEEQVSQVPLPHPVGIGAELLLTAEAVLVIWLIPPEEILLRVRLGLQIH